LLWDSRDVAKEVRRESVKEVIWEPMFKIQLYRMDGTGELGLTRLLFRADQEDNLFYGTSDEGDIVLCDWSIKPPGGKERGKEEVIPEYIIDYYISERNLRPTLEF
jgi:hypothetical protein